MKRLALYRHAKSGWSDPRARDFDRPLNERGRLGAAAMGQHIQAYGARWERIVASPAVRCTETIELGYRAIGETYSVNWDRRIYLASSATLLDLLRELEGDPASLLMVGHNPGLEDLIFDLVPDDGTSPGNPTTVMITVDKLNDAPIANPNNYMVNEGQVLTDRSTIGLYASKAAAKPATPGATPRAPGGARPQY